MSSFFMKNKISSFFNCKIYESSIYCNPKYSFKNINSFSYSLLSLKLLNILEYSFNI